MLSFVAESFVFQFAHQKYNIKVKIIVILSLVLYWCEIFVSHIEEDTKAVST